jgi:hypothetical protein
MERVLDEQMRGRDVLLYVGFDLMTAMAVVACLQLALRHPHNTVGTTSPTAQRARELVGVLIAQFEAQGFPSFAEMLRLGNDPNHDVPGSEQ